MAIFRYRCGDGHIFEQFRQSIAGRDNLPSRPCPLCKSSNWERDTKPQDIQRAWGIKSQNEAFPIKSQFTNKQIARDQYGIVQTDRSGKPIVIKTPVVFESRKQQLQYYDRHGYQDYDHSGGGEDVRDTKDFDPKPLANPDLASVLRKYNTGHKIEEAVFMPAE